ncbi:MAG: hypothetical protein QOE92_804 [Chloroflexota bacterium]|jgi:hypothetical protein|nr:hypothetical protein [Chloroflexota bacterium]
MVFQRFALLGSALFSVGAAGAGFISNSATSLAAAPVAATSPAATPDGQAPACDDGRWKGAGGVNIEGRPEDFSAGDRGAMYVWHDGDGWHLRSTDILPTDHHYSGEIRLSRGASFSAFRTVRLDREDAVWVTGDNVLHYRFDTHNGIDGIDYRVSACDHDRDHEVMVFNLKYNGSNDDAGRIRLGHDREHPRSVPFMVHRTVDS